MASMIDAIYTHSPVWLQNAGVCGYGLMWRQRRYGGKFQEHVREFQAREAFSKEQWRDYQIRQLRQLLLHARHHVPYYASLFSRLGLQDEDLRNFHLKDLPRLPILEKEQIRTKPELFVSHHVSASRLNKYYTSGTTGTPLAILTTTETDRKIQACYEARVRRWAAVDYQMSRAMIGGRLVVPRAHTQPPFWRYNIFERQLYLSAFHVAPANAADYVRALNRFQPDYLVGYASSHYFLARMIVENGHKVHRPKAVLTSSETLTPEMRKTISEAYGCPVFDGYSGVEACCQISECEHHSFHESPDMGIIEVLNPPGNPAAAGECGEIIATGLLNFEQPLIRYRTGDLTVRLEAECKCGRQMPAYREITGRLEDTVIGADGREMVRFHGIFVGLPHVSEGQITQNTHTDFVIRLVADPDFGEAEKTEIQKRFQTRLGDVNLRFDFVDRIDRTPGGKFRAVISHVKRSERPSS